MLRVILLTIGILLLGVALVTVLAGWPIHLVLAPAFFGMVLTVGILFERGRYNPPAPDRPGPDWLATDERFVDPSTGKTISVFYQPTTGLRRYVAQ
jgi:hypothetical protein